MTKDGRLLSNQGDVRVFTDEGVVYTLRFGEVFFGTGDELTSGTPDDAEKKADAKDEKEKDKTKKSQGTTENRYVMVTVSFDPELIAKPKAEDDKEKAKDQPAAKPGEPLDHPGQRLRPRPERPQVHRRPEGSEGEGGTRPEGLREEDRRRQEAGPGADRPVRGLVLRDARRQLPLDQPRPGGAGEAQEGRDLDPGRSWSRFYPVVPRPARFAAADPALSRGAINLAGFVAIAAISITPERPEGRTPGRAGVSSRHATAMRPHVQAREITGTILNRKVPLVRDAPPVRPTTVDSACRTET